MFNEVVKQMKWGNHTLTLKTGKIANQADGAIMASMGDSVILATVVAAPKAKEGQSFFPLTVNYIEKASAAGKIPGGFFKREARPSERETLISRLIDRSIRPLFPENFRNETQLVCTVLSYDETVANDVLALVAASAALSISGLPFSKSLAAAKVGFDGDNFTLNPSITELENSQLELMVAGTKESILMVESEVKELSETQMLDAIKFAQQSFAPVVELIEDLAKEIAKPIMEFDAAPDYTNLTKELATFVGNKIEEAYWKPEKAERKKALSSVHAEVKEHFADNENYDSEDISKALDELEYQIFRNKVVEKQVRIDGRKSSDIRQIATETGLLPRTHGSALFTRGETQSLATTTLGSSIDSQMIDSLEGDSKESFLLHYNFPSYSVGESFPLKPPGRREIGHGKLAWRALKAVLPARDLFPYTIRVTSKITACNGSSSMATICSASISLMDAGVPISAPVAGIAMGLIKQDKDIMILSDIMGDEDKLGDMDFKVAGTEKGVTALQMDIKIEGIDFDIMTKALSQAKDGRLHILGEMAKTITTHKSQMSEYAPQIKTLKVSKDYIRDIIGPGGKMIKEICEVSGAKVDIADDGTITIAGIGDVVEIAEKMIAKITFEPEMGKIYQGVVAKIIEVGAFIKVGGAKDGFVHISEVANERVEKISSYITEGQTVSVKMLGMDHKGKIKLSIKQASADTTPTPTGGTNNDEDVAKPKDDTPKDKKPPKVVKKRKPTEETSKSTEPNVERKYFS